MHERSLVRTLIEQVLDEGRLRNLGRIHGIQLQIGEFSGVEPRLVELAFQEMACEYWPTEVRLSVDVIPLTGECQTCGTAFTIREFRFECAKCHSSDVKVTAGEEMQLVSISAQSPSRDNCHQPREVVR